MKLFIYALAISGAFAYHCKTGCKKNSDCGEFQDYLTCQKDVEDGEMKCVCVENKKWIYANLDGDARNGCETACSVSKPEKCEDPEGRDRFEVCRKDQEEEEEEECDPENEDCEDKPDWCTGKDCEDKPDKPDNEERNCTDTEYQTCVDKLCSDSADTTAFSCFA